MKTLGSIFSVLVFIMIVLINSCEDNVVFEDLDYYNDQIDVNCVETFTEASLYNNTTRSWVDYDANNYCTAYTTSDSIYKSSNIGRVNFSDNSDDYHTYWGNLYKNLYKQDRNKLAPILDSLSQLKTILKLKRNEFANVLVSFVQDIPYTYILFTETCADNDDKSMPCVDGEMFGILSPYEFLHTLKGDCDTRTVLLYTILKHFNYSPKIVNSLEYEHSMLVLDVASSGEHFYKHGKKYYFWETTGTGWESGVIPPGMGNLNYWNVVLD